GRAHAGVLERFRRSMRCTGCEHHPTRPAPPRRLDPLRLQPAPVQPATPGPPHRSV
ncbi:MAG: hypothetical protein AVDCRST_MAG66-149, partial [uncultured Pseudonocardia sp.]